MITLIDVDLNMKHNLPPSGQPIWAFVWWRTDYLGSARLPRVDPATRERVLDEIGKRFAGRVSIRRQTHLAAEASDTRAEDVTVIVVTRDRPAMLEEWLEHATYLNPPPAELLVVDNAPESTESAHLSRRYGARHVVEPHAGIARARNRGMREAATPIVAYVDDDARMDPGFVGAIADAFAFPSITAVTGLVLPLEITTEAQGAFEAHVSMRKGDSRRIFNKDFSGLGLDVGFVGVGTNWAVRRNALAMIGGFDARLGGTYTRGGEDLDIFYRLIEAGYTVLYEPNAVVRHCHRRGRKELIQQMKDWGTGHGAYLAKRSEVSPAMTSAVRRYRWRWFLRHHLRNLLAAILRRQLLRSEIVLAEFCGSTRGARALRLESRLRADRAAIST